MQVDVVDKRPRKRPYSRKRLSRPYKMLGNPYNRIQFYKLRSITAVSSTAGSALSTVITDDPSGYQDWTNVSSLFDSYKVRGIKIQWMPNIPAADPTSSISYKPMYVYYDPDSTTAVGGSTAAIQYNNCKVKNIYESWTYYVKVPTRSADGSTKILAGGYVDCANYSAFSSIGIVGDNFTASSPYGTIVATLYISLKHRR